MALERWNSLRSVWAGDSKAQNEDFYRSRAVLTIEEDGCKY